MRGTVKPLGPKREAKTDAAAFHDAVVRTHGRLCWFNDVARVKTSPGAATTRARKPEERCEGKSAVVVHAMHLVRRSQLGPKSRYALPAINARPGCPTCHRLEDDGLLEFSTREYNAAVRALNSAFPRLGLRTR